MLFEFIWKHDAKKVVNKLKVFLYFLTDKKVIKKMAKTYLLESLNHFQEPGYEDYFFYAFTTKKKVAKKFEQMRDMRKFFKKEVEMDEDGYKELEGNFYSFSALSIQPLLCGEHQHILIPVTTGEYWYSVESRSESIYSMMEIMPKIRPDIFEEKIIQLLGKLDYNDSMFPDFQPYREYTSDTHDYMLNNGWKNELGVFLFLYSMIVIPTKVISEGEYE